MNKGDSKLFNLLTAIVLAVAILFSAFSASDVHADEIFNTHIDQVQFYDGHDHNSDKNDNNPHDGICLHSGCHHNVNGAIFIAAVNLLPLQYSGKITVEYKSAPFLNLTQKLKRPPRQ